MAKVDILYHCGCGFRTHDQTAAERHCDEKRHDLSVTGMIKSSTRTHPSQAFVEGQQLQKTTRASRPAEPTPAISPADTQDFNRLRRMLGGSQKSEQ